MSPEYVVVEVSVSAVSVHLVAWVFEEWGAIGNEYFPSPSGCRGVLRWPDKPVVLRVDT